MPRGDAPDDPTHGGIHRAGDRGVQDEDVRRPRRALPRPGVEACGAGGDRAQQLRAAGRVPDHLGRRPRRVDGGATRACLIHIRLFVFASKVFGAPRDPQSRTQPGSDQPARARADVCDASDDDDAERVRQCPTRERPYARADPRSPPVRHPGGGASAGEDVRRVSAYHSPLDAWHGGIASALGRWVGEGTTTAPDGVDAHPAAVVPWVVWRAGGSCRRGATSPSLNASSSSSLLSEAFVTGGDGVYAPPGEPGDELAWYCRRTTCIAAVLCAFVGPLCFMRSLQSLGFSSFLSVSSMCTFVAVLAGKLVTQTSAGRALPPIPWVPDLDRVSVREVISVTAVMTTAYVCQYCVHPLYSELKGATPKKFTRIAASSLTLCTSIYCCVSTMAVALFGDGTHADVLVSFTHDSVLEQGVVKLGYVMSLSFTYPMIFCIMRDALVELAVVKESGRIGGFGLVVSGPRGPRSRLRGRESETSVAVVAEQRRRLAQPHAGAPPELHVRAHLLGRTSVDANGADEAYEDEDGYTIIAPVVDPATPPSMILGPWWHGGVTSVLLVAQFVLAIVTPDIEVALGFLGSTLSVFVAFVAPAAVALAAGRSAPRAGRRGGGGANEGEEGDVDDIDAPLLLRGGGGREAGSGEGDGEGGSDGWVASPRWLAALVLCFGVAVGAAGLTVATWNAISPQH